MHVSVQNNNLEPIMFLLFESDDEIVLCGEVNVGVNVF
jgi:hypothetical protein